MKIIAVAYASGWLIAYGYFKARRGCGSPFPSPIRPFGGPPAFESVNIDSAGLGEGFGQIIDDAARIVCLNCGVGFGPARRRMIRRVVIRKWSDRSPATASPFRETTTNTSVC